MTKRLADSMAKIIIHKAMTTKDLRVIRPSLLTVAALAEIQLRTHSVNNETVMDKNILHHLKAMRCALDVAITMAEDIKAVISNHDHALMLEDSLKDASVNAFMAYQAWEEIINGPGTGAPVTPIHA